jgi:hypothetical protein
MLNETFGITWDYDPLLSPGYVIRTGAGPLEDRFEPCVLCIPETAEDTQDVQIIVEALRRIAARQEGSSNG